MSIYIEGVSTIEDMEKILEHMLNPNKTSQEKVFKNIPMKSAECTRCKKGHMVVRNGKHGIFAGCALLDIISNLGKKSVGMDVRIDPRDVGALYYLQENKLMRASLNERKFGQTSWADD